MSIPLIQETTKDAINTSIIAIKRNIERINMLLGLVDSVSPDLSGLATKQELEDAVNSLQPVDEVTVDNMHSVTSNAVADALARVLARSNVRTGFITGGSSNNDDWYATFDTPFVDYNYRVICTPRSSSAICPTSWYTVTQTVNGFRLFCLGSAPTVGFDYIAIRN